MSIITQELTQPSKAQQALLTKGCPTKTWKWAGDLVLKIAALERHIAMQKLRYPGETSSQLILFPLLAVMTMKYDRAVMVMAGPEYRHTVQLNHTP